MRDFACIALLIASLAVAKAARPFNGFAEVLQRFAVWLHDKAVDLDPAGVINRIKG